MKTIHKHYLDVGLNALSFGNGYEILKVGEQNGCLCIWVLHDVNHFFVTCTFEVHATGSDLTYYDTKNFVGTILLHESSEAWHVFQTDGVDYAGKR